MFCLCCQLLLMACLLDATRTSLWIIMRNGLCDRLFQKVMCELRFALESTSRLRDADDLLLRECAG